MFFCRVNQYLSNDVPKSLVIAYIVCVELVLAFKSYD